MGIRWVLNGTGKQCAFRAGKGIAEEGGDEEGLRKGGYCEKQIT